MSTLQIAAALATCLGLALGPAHDALGSPHTSDRGALETTQRRVRGIITEVDATTLTISAMLGRANVSGRIDPYRTRVIVDGRPARSSELKLTNAAAADLSLDDVWLTVRMSTGK
jgi:hypothetical protein